jgi:esterase
MLYSRQAGSGEPVILLHGLFGSLENLGGIARQLSQDFTVHSVDLPNHGRSPHCSGTDLAVMAESVRDWMLQFGLSGAWLVGHSLGGKVAMELALSDGALVRGLVVMDIAPVEYKPRHEAVFRGLHAIDPAQLQSREEAEQRLAEHVPEAAVRSFLLKNLVRENGAFRWRMNLADLEAQYTGLIRANRDGVFAGPVLFLKGGESDYMTADHRLPILQRFPQAEYRVIAGSGHWLHADKPGLVSAQIKKFLQKSIQDRPLP